FGTSQFGGVSNQGSIFRILTNSSSVAILASFDGSHGAQPTHGALLYNGGTNFLGTTEIGDTADDGNVFEMLANGAITTRVAFNGTNGAFPQAGVIRASDGNLYGATAGG